MLIESTLNRYTRDLLPSERYKWLKEHIEADQFCINYPNFLGQIPRQLETTLLINPECRKWVVWVNKNIILNLTNPDYRIVNVLLRIATGMLNKLNAISRTEKIEIHQLLTSSVQKELIIIRTETLPF